MAIAKGYPIATQAGGDKEKSAEPSFSLFNAPATNVTPARSITVGEAWQVITQDQDTLSATLELRRHDPEKEREERKQLKRTRFKFCTFSGTFSRRSRAGLLSHSQLLSIDLDHVGRERVDDLKWKLASDKNFETALCFRSPSGDGVKWVAVIDTERATHEEWFDATCLYLKDKYGLEADRACRDVTRSCFLPHDGEAIIGNQFKKQQKMKTTEKMKTSTSIFDPKTYLATKRGALQGAAAGKAAEREYQSRCSYDMSGMYETNGSSADSFTDMEKARMVADAVIRSGADITAQYHDWVRIGYALAHSFGEGGRGIYHDVSSLYPGYRREQCDSQYDSCLRGRSAAGGAQLGTFFEIARRTAGVSVADVMREERMKMKNSGNDCSECSNVSASQNNCHNHSNNIYNIDNKEVMNKNMDSKRTLAQTDIPNKSPEKVSNDAYIISNKINKTQLPRELQRIYELYTDNVKRDIILLATLNVASGLLGSCNGANIADAGIFGIYANQNVAPPFYLMIYGSQGTGKGEVSVCRHIIRPLQNKLNSQYHNEMEAYELAMDRYELSRKDKKSVADSPARKPRHPVCIRPVLEGNGTAASLYDTLNGNGGWGIMFESEADTMTQMINTDFGNYSALLRAAYHHETASMGRATEKLHICIDAPRLSVLVTCTPGQIIPFLGTFEDGLASRFLYYGLPGRKPVFEDPFKRTTKPLDKEFQKMGEALAKLLETLRKRGGKPLEFVITQDMQKQFCNMFRDALEDDTMMLGDDYQGFIYRQGLICFRIAMVLTAFRQLDNKTDEKLGILDAQQSLVCDTRDFNTAKTIAEVMARHTAKVYATLAEETTNKFASKPLTDDEARFYNLLPDGVFEMSCAVDIVKRVFKGSRSMANRFISKLRDKYSIIVRLKQGHYIKAELYDKERLAENAGSASGNNLNADPNPLN